MRVAVLARHRRRARRRRRPRAARPNASSGRSVLARRPSSRRRTTRPSAPCSWAAPAPPPSPTSTSTEMPSPSAIAWLSRRAPVTDRDATRSGRGRGGRATDSVGCAGGRAGQARLPARCRIDGQDARSPATLADGVRDGLEPRVRASLHRDRPRSATRRGRATSSPTSPGSSAGTRTASPRRRDAVLFCDTDAFTTAVFHEVYLGEPTHAFDDLARAALRPRSSSAGSTCRGSHDGIREFEEQRHWMHERYLERARGERGAVGAARGAARRPRLQSRLERGWISVRGLGR